MSGFDNAKVYKPRESCTNLCNYVQGNTMLTNGALRTIYEVAIVADMLDGEVAEAGVYKGGASYVIASVMRHKIVHCFDSWEGLPDIHEFDVVTRGSCINPETFSPNTHKTLKHGWGKSDPPYELLSKFGDRIQFHKGWFKNTFSDCNDSRFCFVHIDADRYESTKQSLEFFWPRMVQGGFIIIDDYKFCITPGVTPAVDDFLQDKKFDVWMCDTKPILKVL